MSACLKRYSASGGRPCTSRMSASASRSSAACSGCVLHSGHGANERVGEAAPDHGSRSAPPRAPGRAGRAAPSTIAAASAGSPGCRPARRAPTEAASLPRRTAARRRCARSRPRSPPSAARGGRQAPPPCRAPDGGRAARARSCRDASACPRAAGTRAGQSRERTTAPARRVRRCRASTSSVVGSAQCRSSNASTTG